MRHRRRRLRRDAGPERPVTIVVDDEAVTGVDGQTIAGVLLGSGLLSWRQTRSRAEPRGLFCGIGVCFDCIVTVNGLHDVRACQRRAIDGDTVRTRQDPFPIGDA